MVFKTGRYTIRVGEPGTARVKILPGVEPLAPREAGTIEVSL
jgi:hypothetical protein